MSQKQNASERKSSLPAASIALVFLVLGFQTALFVYRAASDAVLARIEQPDTVFVYLSPEAEEPERPAVPLSQPESVRRTEKRSAAHRPRTREIVREHIQKQRTVESFPFDPNEVSIEDLMRLGFSEKQAESLAHYRERGGRFHRKSDFAKSYVVADSVYARLEAYIRIPPIDLNRADSATLTRLPGIGPWFAGQIIRYRSQLGGFSYPEQLLEVYRFDAEKYAGLSDLISLSPPPPYPLWELDEEALARHPYISASAAHGIVLFRMHHAPQQWTLAALTAAGVLKQGDAERLGRCVIAEALP